MTNLDRFKAYLAAYARKDLQAIRAMFSERIHLRDWTLSVHGKRAALLETERNFAAVQTLEIEILSVLESAQAVAGELKILIDGQTALFVLDLVEFDERGDISAIRAYLGRPSD